MFLTGCATTAPRIMNVCKEKGHDWDWETAYCRRCENKYNPVGRDGEKGEKSYSILNLFDENERAILLAFAQAGEGIFDMATHLTLYKETCEVVDLEGFINYLWKLAEKRFSEGFEVPNAPAMRRIFTEARAYYKILLKVEEEKSKLLINPKTK